MEDLTKCHMPFCSNVSTQHPSFAATVVEINKVLQGYDDTSAASHIDHELGESTVCS